MLIHESLSYCMSRGSGYNLLPWGLFKLILHAFHSIHKSHAYLLHLATESTSTKQTGTLTPFSTLSDTQNLVQCSLNNGCTQVQREKEREMTLQG
jgi:hypothetical protein